MRCLSQIASFVRRAKRRQVCVRGNHECYTGRCACQRGRYVWDVAAGARTAGCWVGGAPANHRLCALSKTPLMMLPLMTLLLTPCLTPRTLLMLRPRPILLPLSTLPPRHPNPRHPLTPLMLVVTATVTIHRTLTMLRRVWMPPLVMILPRNCLLQPAPELALGLAHVPGTRCLRKASGSKAASVVALSSALQLQQRFVPPLLRLRGGWR